MDAVECEAIYRKLISVVKRGIALNVAKTSTGPLLLPVKRYITIWFLFTMNRNSLIEMHHTIIDRCINDYRPWSPIAFNMVTICSFYSWPLDRAIDFIITRCLFYISTVLPSKASVTQEDFYIKQTQPGLFCGLQLAETKIYIILPECTPLTGKKAQDSYKWLK